ncbi:12453_t:CDS:2 [Ambispora leptoticha]|uniref:12453_t:CDS:1 n=1 Tax=Ambispora leptoticha TaxID=144679 RepID=A0A9N9IC42_9GLOM|nr:12453_t:CDS:2 [Ambispora leptoticha]
MSSADDITTTKTNDTTTTKTNEPNPKTNGYIYLNCLITFCVPHHFFKIKLFKGNTVETLETQVQARLSLLPPGAANTPRRNNPDQNIIHVLVEQLPGSETQII